MVPTCYGRQAILYEFGGFMTSSMSTSIDSNRAVDCKAIAVVLTVSFEFCFLDACVSYKSGADDLIVNLSILLLNHVKPSNSRFCYMVKPHEQLVLVSSTPRSASTPNLSTS